MSLAHGLDSSHHHSLVVKDSRTDCVIKVFFDLFDTFVLTVLSDLRASLPTSLTSKTRDALKLAMIVWKRVSGFKIG